MDDRLTSTVFPEICTCGKIYCNSFSKSSFKHYTQSLDIITFFKRERVIKSFIFTEEKQRNNRILRSTKKESSAGLQLEVIREFPQLGRSSWAVFTANSSHWRWEYWNFSYRLRHRKVDKFVGFKNKIRRLKPWSISSMAMVTKSQSTCHMIY